ncbi:MAG: hypothetical protein ACJ77N_02800 [Chloroflexota bacterium]
MTLVDCPLCETAAPFDPGDDALECAECGVRVDLAADEERALALAA